MHVGIMELQSLPNLLSHNSHILNTPDSDVSVFARDVVLEETGDDLEGNDDFDVHIFEDQSVVEYLKHVQEFASENLDILVINSMFGGEKQLEIYSLLDPACRTLLWLHSVRLWFERFDGKPKEQNYDVRQEILENVDGLITSYPPLRDYIEQNTGWDKKAYSLAPVYQEFDSACVGVKDPAEDQLEFVLPGKIDPRRKEYIEFLDSYSRVAEKFDNCRLELLGSAKSERGQPILEHCRELNETREVDIEFHDDNGWLPESQFTESVSNAEIILSPTTNEYVGPMSNEVYGTTKMSGSIRDAIRFSKPVLLPDHFELPEKMDGLATVYSEDDLEDTIERIITDEQMRENISRSAAETAKKFDLPSQRNRWLKITEDLL